MSFKDKTHYMVEPTSTTTIPLKGPSMYEYGHASPLAISVGMSVMLTTQAPLLGGHNDVNIPHWLGDKDLNCLYSTKGLLSFQETPSQKQNPLYDWTHVSGGNTS